MKLTVRLEVGPEELFEALVRSVCYDIEGATGKKVDPKRLKRGYSYRKELRTKTGAMRPAKVRITEFERPGRYAASFTSADGTTTVGYAIEPAESGAGAVRVTYEETFDSASAWNRANGKLTGSVYGLFAKRRVRRMLKDMEAYIKNERNSHE